MPQVMDNSDVQPISDPLSDAFGWVSYVPEAVVRSLKRLFREQVTPNDYSQIWAEIREDGTIVRGSNSDYPEFVLCATRISDKDEWRVEKQKRDPIVIASPQDGFVETNNSVGIVNIPTYKTIEDLGIFTADEVHFLMRVVDPEPRSSWSHYSRAFG